MAPLPRLVLSFLLLCFATTTIAQQTYPPCAATCLATALSQNICELSDRKCLCTNPQFQSVASTCIAKSCIIPDVLIAKNVSATNCGAPVRNRAPDYAHISNALAALALVFVVIRFVTKLFIVKAELGWDDWSVLATLVAAAPSAFITPYGMIPNGLGRDMWTLTANQIYTVIEYFYIMAWLYFLQITLLKLSLLFFYLRVFPRTEIRRLLWGTIVFVSVWGLSFVLIAVFQCRPIHYFWTKWDGLHKGTCLSANKVSWANAGFSIALDLWILAIPMWEIRQLKMHWKKKIGVAVMFGVGTFVTVVSVIRLQTLVEFAKSANATWEFTAVSIWSTIEITVGIICACLPTVRLLVVKLWPRLAGTTIKSKTTYGETHRSGNKSQANRSRLVVGGTQMDPGDIELLGEDKDQGIVVKTHYVVERSSEEGSVEQAQEQKQERK
ncbi:CFEM domain-containing protein [Elsinoe ampelina]|uniref:CFEM domain-containing protein n=1 Tax=Elsinoe ampelina TaxID=302913 RepID=A0A6A6GK01_9PEZI|nr:CFEM domain-containing protein [Elsinoe ampelina]